MTAACPCPSGCLELALKELKGKQRAFIVTDKPLFDLGYTDKVTKVLDEVNVHHQVGETGRVVADTARPCFCVCVCQLSAAGWARVFALLPLFP